MEDFMTPERKSYIAQLEKQIQAMDRILRMDAGTVISQERRRQLQNLREDSKKVLNKLVNNEFEIAIVGLEKAGKSTFANALMENPLLPTKDARCTFTSTQIEYSGDSQPDSATVTFYTVDEFNQDFRDKLSKLGIPNPEKYSFDTLNEATYNRLYESEVSEDKQRAYGDSIHPDIVSIIQNETSLSSLLDRPPLAFSSAQIESGELTAYITDEAKARAVKQVVIHSRKLFEMKNAVIFDVPGFNSPTELHKAQTLARMKSADAIIVVASGTSPSLTGESLKILRESDDEGNLLQDKLFVFANKTDGADDIGLNIQETYKEWIGKKFILEKNKHRIVFGSALAHLQAAGLSKDDRVLKVFREREAQMPDGDGIDAMRKQLASYNQNERFDVLCRRVNRIRAELNNLFQEIGASYSDQAAARSYSVEQFLMIQDLIYNICPALEKKLLDLSDNIRHTIPEEKPLSHQIEQFILDNVTVEKCAISDEMLEEQRKRTPYTGTHEDTARIEGNIREMKFNEMYEDFSQNVVRIVGKRHLEYSEQILQILLDTMDISPDSPYYEDLKQQLTEEIANYRLGLIASDNNCAMHYQSLIERFSRDIYQVLITSQYNTERLREFYEDIDNFYSLSIFYKTSDKPDDLSYIDVAPKDQPLCMMLLFHHYLNAADSFRQLLDNVCRITGLRTISPEMEQEFQQVFRAVGNQCEAVLDCIQDTVRRIPDFAGKPEGFQLKILRMALSGIVDTDIPSVSERKAFTSYYENYHNSLHGGKLYSLENFRADFNVDIQILQDVLLHAFIRAISMEKPFIAREVKSINDIIAKYIQNNKFSSFIIQNYYKIRYHETQQFDKKRRVEEQKAAILREINGILGELNTTD